MRGRAAAPVRHVASLAALLALAQALPGCGGGAARARGTGGSVPAYVTAPPTAEQRLVEVGARLIVADGCSACHLSSLGRGIAPSFGSLAGHAVLQADGERALIDEPFIAKTLENPARVRMAGYDAAPMIAAVHRSGLGSRPGDVRALAAFVEQVGAEP